MSEELKSYDVSNENSRTYTIYSAEGVCYHEVYIKDPRKLFIYKDGDHAFHRIFDGDTVHLAPVPGFIWGSCGKITGYCELKWVPKDKNDPCKF